MFPMYTVPLGHSFIRSPPPPRHPRGNVKGIKGGEVFIRSGVLSFQLAGVAAATAFILSVIRRRNESKLRKQDSCEESE